MSYLIRKKKKNKVFYRINFQFRVKKSRDSSDPAEYFPEDYKSISSSVLVLSISPDHYYKVIFYVEFNHKH